MQVHTIRVSYLREKQPKDYEKAAPAVEMSAAIEDGEDHVEKGLALMTSACKIAYAALGLDIPSAVAAKLGAGEVPNGGKTEIKKADAKPKADQKKADEKKAKKDDDGDIPDDDGSSKKRTPPPEGKKADSKKTDDGDIPDDDAPKADSKKADDDGDIPDDDAPKGRAISDSPEDRKPEDESDIPDEGSDEDDDGEEKLTNDSLFDIVQKKVSDKELTPAGVKEILAGFGVVRVSELPEDKLAEAKEQIELACQK